MSVVAVKVYDNRIEMAADSIIVCGSRQETYYGKHAKIKEINDMIIGTAGSCEEESLMWLYAQNHRPAAENLLELVFRDGKMIKETSLKEIRIRMYGEDF